MPKMDDHKDESKNSPLTMTPADLADMLGIGRNAAYNLVKAGKFRTLRIGRKILIPRAAVMEWLNGTE